ncbi:unnamed protein product [Blepharisma stoltei]|uniref:Uncharacterized protein n=1 Tax=Blepharisma stoltei TaxID=1481888 RepID=A0AAU9IJQ7_9CILI|nr:unnamed protein product [Blepharisma stoltei]
MVFGFFIYGAFLPRNFCTIRALNFWSHRALLQGIQEVQGLTSQHIRGRWPLSGPRLWDSQGRVTLSHQVRDADQNGKQFIWDGLTSWIRNARYFTTLA